MTINTRSRTPWYRMMFLAALAAAVSSGSARAGAITGIVAFGDSLSDVGNTYNAAGIPPSPPYYQGGYSNGPNWLGYLAGRLGVATPTASLLGGTDYAWGGAETGSGISSQATPNLGSQVQGFLADGHTLTAGQLVTVWGGANDFLNGGQTDPTVVVANIASAITSLAGVGGKQFLVPNLPLLGELPATNTQPQPVRDALDGLTLAFNSLLAIQLAGLSQSLGIVIDTVDVEGAFQKILADPSAYGLVNVTDSALAAGSDGQGYLFWDMVHPTTAVHEIIAQAAFNAVVPEPSSIALLAISVAALAGGQGARSVWRRRAA